MKNISIGILMIILLSIVVEPMVEMGNVLREKIIIGSALTNSCRAAKDIALDYNSIKDLDAGVDQEELFGYFRDAFEEALNLSYTNETTNQIGFTSNDMKYNDFTVYLELQEDTDWSTGIITNQLHVKAEIPYKFKTKYLKVADGSLGNDVSYIMVLERMYIISVRN